MRGILYYPPLIIRNPSFGYLFGGEACHDRGIASGYVNFNSKGQVLLRNDPIGRFRMWMFFRHDLNMVIDRVNSK
jgi:hypothetical protein